MFGPYNIRLSAEKVSSCPDVGLVFFAQPSAFCSDCLLNVTKTQHLSNLLARAAAVRDVPALQWKGMCEHVTIIAILHSAHRSLDFSTVGVVYFCHPSWCTTADSSPIAEYVCKLRCFLR